MYKKICNSLPTTIVRHHVAIIASATQMLKPMLKTKFGSWNSRYTLARMLVPNCVISRNRRTDWGFIGEANRRLTSAGKKIRLPFLSAPIASKAKTIRITPPTISSTKSFDSIPSFSARPGSSSSITSLSTISSSPPAASSSMAAPMPMKPPIAMQMTRKIRTQVLNSLRS